MNKPETKSDKTPSLRMTPQRKAILEEFGFANRHLTADDVYTLVRKKMPNISLGTVYRNLDILVQTRQIKMLNVGSAQKLYDGGMHRHYHVRCVTCGVVSDIPAEKIGDLEGAASGYGFEILGHELTYEGLCSNCSSGPQGLGKLI